MTAAGALVMLALAGTASAQQQILLDKPVRAGDLILFPDLNDTNAYYYVVDKPKLATDENGQPQFSFLRYVENVGGTGGADAPREGDGGGIVHAVVSLSVTRDQIQAAQRELQRVKPGATVKGPVIFKSGKFGLVTSFKDPNGKLATQVVGLGNAPILDGEKAAVSMQLTKLGAKVLWESFQTAAPDISFSFEMELPGYMSPKRAVIDANWDTIYQHQAFSAGVASQYLAGEIRAALEDLTRSGAIKVTQVGADTEMDAAINTAYGKLMELMFSPVNGTGTPSLSSLTEGIGGSGTGSLLDRATAMYQRNHQEARDDSKEAGAKNEEARKHNADLNAKRREAAEAERTARVQHDRADADKNRAAEIQKQIEAIETRTNTLKPQLEAAQARAKQLAAEAGNDAAKKQAATGAQNQADLLAVRVKLAEGQLSVLRNSLKEAETAATDGAQTATAADQEASTARASAPSESEDIPIRDEGSGGGGLAIVAAYEMKRVRQSGHYTIDLNKYTTDSLTLRFDENIGDLRSLMADAGHFRQVNLDDPLFRQREIAVFVDGLNAQDFGQYINFVTVQMRKKHATGDTTEGDVRIDRSNFNKEGNRFSFLYGWKNDTDRRRWLEYEYRPVWSFFGGVPVEGKWTTTTDGALNMAPPFQRRSVDIQASPDAVQKSGIRAITVRLFYTIAGVEKSKSVTLNAAKNQLSEKLEFMLPADSTDYAYEITWQLTGNRTLSSGRQTGSSACCSWTKFRGPRRRSPCASTYRYSPSSPPSECLLTAIASPRNGAIRRA
jgi:hypothetical protein